jgi:hypothetical protein
MREIFFKKKVEIQEGRKREKRITTETRII